MKSLFVGRSGNLENTVFAILRPDGKGVLAAADRSPRHHFADARELAETMNRLARPYAASERGGPRPLPLLPTVRLALNTAACDNRPLAVIFSGDVEIRKRLEDRLASLAWSDGHVGRFAFAAAGSFQELSAVRGVPNRPGLFVIQPDQFGQTGTLLAQADANASREQLSAVLTRGKVLHQQRDKTEAHVKEGHRLRVFWETTIPVTDPWEKMARERGRNGGGPRP